MAALLLVASSAPAAAGDAPAAVALFDQAAAKFAAVPVLKLSYTLTTEDPVHNITANENGRLWISGRHYHLLSSKRELIRDGKTLWSRDQGTRSATWSHVHASNEPLCLSLLAGNLAAHDFLVQSGKDIKEGGLVYAQIDMQPADHKNDVFRIEILIARMNAQFRAVKLFRTNGVRESFVITAIDPSPAVAADFFTAPTTTPPVLLDRDAPSGRR